MAELCLACDLLINKLPDLVSSSDLEVQERASSTLALVKIVQEDLAQNRASPADLARDIGALFCGELNPVAPKAQKKVPLPEGLNLDEWINDPPSSSSEEDNDNEDSQDIFIKTDIENKPRQPEPTEEQMNKMREARKQEQANNPHYLKPNNNMDDSFHNHSSSLIPSLDSDTNPIQEIPGLISSDKYLYKKERSSSKKKKHKKRKSKRHEESSEEEEEEDNQAFEIQVNRGKGEMPEGAEESDGEGSDIRADTSDPHRALDINLDEPLRDEERLPTLNQYLITPPIQLITTPKKKKSSKKFAKENGSATMNQVGNLLGMDYMEVPDDTPAVKKKKKKTKDKEKKSEEKTKKSKGKKKKLSTSEQEQDQEESPGKSKEGYEEPQGISTPSKEVFLSSRPSFPSLSSLGSNRDLSVEYLVQGGGSGVSLSGDSSSDPEITVLLILHNHHVSHLKNIDVNLSQSHAYSLVRHPVASGPGYEPSSVRLLAELSPGSRQESNLTLKFSEASMNHKIRGTLSYISQNKDGSTEDKLDFWLSIPVTAFIYPAQLSGSLSYTELLSSGSLEYKHSASLSVSPGIPFTQVLDQICAQCHLGVMEKIDSTASLYGRTGQAVHICALLKHQAKPGTLGVELKTSSPTLGSHLMNEISRVVASLTS
ncbi:hypothetical protein M8J77_013087 [Diaphorina citri]|nr:hypothetical protein M8J77_013087 [Diaphorina citri]